MILSFGLGVFDWILGFVVLIRGCLDWGGFCVGVCAWTFLVDCAGKTCTVLVVCGVVVDFVPLDLLVLRLLVLNVLLSFCRVDRGSTLFLMVGNKTCWEAFCFCVVVMGWVCLRLVAFALVLVGRFFVGWFWGVGF